MQIPSKKTYYISVHQFVDMSYVGGDLGSSYVSTDRMQKGIQTHKKRQEESGHDKEVSLEYRTEGINIKIVISGRADILDMSGEYPVIEEIKTLFDDSKKAIQARQEHLAQLKCYCAMYVLKENTDEIGGRLAYVNYHSGKSTFINYTFTKDEILDWFHDKLNAIVESFEKKHNHVIRRDLSIREMKFPYGEYRLGQEEMATRVFKACRDGAMEFLQAPTGIGKTLGALYPSLKAMPYEEVEKVFYLSARGTIKKIAENAISDMREKGLYLTSLTLTAKEKSCPQKIYNCHPSVCQRARGYYDRLGKALNQVEGNVHYNMSDIRKIADRFNLCPFELSLDISFDCDVVICDYNNVYDPRAKLKRFFNEGGDYVVLVDEAHNLVDRARNMYSAEINKEEFVKLKGKLIKNNSEKETNLKVKINQIIDCFDAQICLMKESNISFETMETSPDSFNSLLEDFCELAEPLIDQTKQTLYSNDLLEVFFDVKGYLYTLSKLDECYCGYINMRGEDVLFKLFCIDPSNRLQECHNKVKSTMFFSASLTPFGYYTRLLKNDAGYDTCALPSPFDPNNIKIMINSTTSVTYKARDNTLVDVVNCIHSFINSKKGNYLIFFPSYSYMIQVHNLFISLYDDIFAPKQEKIMSEKDRQDFINLFNEEDSHMAAFAVMGGIFSEGIDLMGDKLIGAVVVGTGLPMINSETNLIKAYHDKNEELGFAYAYIYPGFNKVLQAVGRVIRSEDDKGAILLIDKRFVRQEYIEMMPDWWKPITFVDDEDDIKSELSNFW